MNVIRFVMNVLVNSKRPEKKELNSKMKICAMNAGIYQTIIAFVAKEAKKFVKKI